MRPHQWVKNLLILVPLLTAQHFEALGMGLLAMLVCVSFSLSADLVTIVFWVCTHLAWRPCSLFPVQHGVYKHHQYIIIFLFVGDDQIYFSVCGL